MPARAPVLPGMRARNSRYRQPLVRFGRFPGARASSPARFRAARRWQGSVSGASFPMLALEWGAYR